MTRVKPGQRQRAKAPKVRSGCRTCKIRKIKCDETKPECRKCASTGRKCDGYDLSLQVPGERSQSTSIPSSPSSALTRTPDEARSFQFFREETLEQMTFQFSDELWEKSIFQMAEVEPCIRHALSALSSFHENSPAIRGTGGEGQLSFALNQYNLAIRELLKFQGAAQDQTSLMLHMVSCVIFISIEILRGQYDVVIRLYHQGRRVISECKRNRHLGSNSPNDLFPRLEALFVRLGIQLIQLLDDKEALQAICEGWDMDGSLPPLPAEFHSLSEAREAMERYACSILGAISVNAIEARAVIDAHRAYLERWLAALAAFEEAAGDQLTESEMRGIAMLRLHQKEVELTLRLRENLENRNEPWDQFTEHFDEMLDLSEMANRSDRCADDSGRALDTPRFCMDIGYISVLYLIIVRSRVDRVRERALRLLRRCHRQEGREESP